jgi:O-antigen/teichoic acid export membrane protein
VTNRLFRSYLVNASGTGVQTVIALVTVPIYIHHIGSARYGILSIVWILLGYFGFLDFGLSRASANALGRMRDAPRHQRARVLTTTLYLNLALGVVGSCLLYVTGLVLLKEFVLLEGELRTEVLAAFPWTVLMLPLAMVSSIGIGALESRERFLSANILQITGYVLGQLAPVGCAIFVSPSLAVLVPAALAGRALATITVFAFVVVAEGGVNPRAFDRAHIPRLFKYGAWVSVTNLLNPILSSADQIMIGTLLGPTPVAYYAVPMNLAVRGQLVASSLARTLFPRMSHLDAMSARALASRSAIALAYLFAAVCAAGIMFIGAFLDLWVGPAFAAESVHVGQILLIGAWVNGIAFIPFGLLQAQGRPDVIAKLHAIQFIPCLLLFFAMTKLLSLEGAAIAWTLRVAFDALLLFVLAGLPVQVVARLILPGVPLVGFWALARVHAVGLWPEAAWAAAAAMTVCALGLALEPGLRGPCGSLLARASPRLLGPGAKSYARSTRGDDK